MPSTPKIKFRTHSMECPNWGRLTVGFFIHKRKSWKVVTKYTFSGLFRKVWYKTISPELIVAGFHRVGICPFDCTAIQEVRVDECKAGVDPTQDINEDQIKIPMSKRWIMLLKIRLVREP